MNEEDYAEETRETLKAMIDGDEVTHLRCELAVIVDIGKHLTQFCYSNERDGELQCAKSYDHWKDVFDYLKEVVRTTSATRLSELLPSVHSNALALSGNNVNSDQYKSLMSNAVDAIKPIKNRMTYYTDTAIERTLRILRACRFFNYKFVAKSDANDLGGDLRDDSAQEEMIHLHNVAYFHEDDVIVNLKRELLKYKAAADEFAAENGDDDNKLWTFWKQNRDRLPHFFKAACEIAIIQPSSATVERLFSYLSSAFHDDQKHALEDYKATSTMLRYNENMRTLV
jgi:hypothetical protein